jgi:hypothetical protein
MIVVAHYGGVMPMILDRLDHEAPPRVPGLAEPPSDYPVTLFFEPYAKNFDCIREADLPETDVERIMGGTARELLGLRLPATA